MAIFEEKYENHVKEFLHNKIVKECDADPSIMTDYILVTLQNEISTEELKGHCKTDLVEFFGEKTSDFVDTLFDALLHKRYLPSTTKKESSRRRSRSPTGDEDSRQHRHHRSSNGSHRDRRGGRSRSPEREERRPAAPIYNGASGMDRQAMLNGPLEPALTIAGGATVAAQPHPMRRMKPCFEFMRKGSCQRGDNCNYSHAMPDQQQQPGMMMGQQQGGFPMRPSHPQQGRPNMPYHPQQMPMQQMHPGGGHPFMRPPPSQPHNGDPSQLQQQQQQPQFVMSNTAVFVTNIPDTALDESVVRQSFEKFGQINSIRMDLMKHNATVDFVDNNAQMQALSTPEAMFNNRFVRIQKARIPAHLAGNTGFEPGNNNNAAAGPPVWKPKSAAIKKAELIEKHVGQQKELMKKLTANKDMPAATRKIIMESINQIQTKIDNIRKPKQPPAATTAAAAAAATATEPTSEVNETSDVAATTTTTEDRNQQLDAVESEKQALQSKLKALQMEAARLNANKNKNAAAAARGSMTLDKRPRTLILRNLNTEDQQLADRLPGEMAQFGKVESFDKTDGNDGFVVKFSARWEAENAMKALPSAEGLAGVSIDWDQ